MAFNLSSITRETRMRAPKGILYGPPGVGKTTFGASTGGVIVDTENGIPTGLDVLHTPYLDSWPAIQECLDAIYQTSEKPAVLVIDTCDWMLRRMEEHVSGTDGTAKGMASTLNKSQGGYGNGKQVLRNYCYQYLLPQLDRFVNCGTGILLLAHTVRRELTSQEGATFERSMPAIHADLADVMIEWADFVGAACVVGQERSLILNETNQLVAKNRYGIGSPIPLDWNYFMSCMTRS